jgi:ribosomal protein L24E
VLPVCEISGLFIKKDLYIYNTCHDKCYKYYKNK